jgi:5'-AMP-activated protein kinase catalytic alpha subunit
MPSSFSDHLKDLIKRVLVVDPARRFTVHDIRAHPWYNIIEPSEKVGTLIGKTEIPIDEVIIDKVCKEY